VIDHDTIDWTHVVALRRSGNFDGATQEYPGSQMLLPSGAWVETGMPLDAAKQQLFAARALRDIRGRT
jgi:hypothetical protein